MSDERTAAEKEEYRAGNGRRTVVRMKLVDANASAQITGRDELPGKSNYFIGNDPKKWRTNIPTYARIQYKDVYPGVDLVYYGNQRQLEYDLVVAPGADPKAINLAFQGADKLEIDAEGNLVLHLTGGRMIQRTPVIYQEINGVKHAINGGYILRGKKHVAFQIGAYDVSKSLVIDPVVLSYSSYLGGSQIDLGNSIAVDGGGNAYVTGSTDSGGVGVGLPLFPTTPGAFPFGGGTDAFVTKVNAAGNALIYSTFLGGSLVDVGNGIAVDAGGNAYVTGSTNSNNFPTTPGPLTASSTVSRTLS